MARVTILLGLLLCGLTMIGLLAPTVGKTSSAFVPMIFGIPLVIAGIVGLNPHRRRICTTFACALAFIGGFGPPVLIQRFGVEWLGNEPVHRLPLILSGVLSLACIVYAVSMAVLLWKTRR